jgi:type III secretory pathway lipoprotein EscJ
VPEDRRADAAALLSADGVAAEADSDGTVRLAVASDEDMAHAIRVLAIAGVPVYEARVSAELEELFEPEADA